MECEPADRLETGRLAVPETRLTVPRTVVPSLKITEPAGSGQPVTLKLWLTVAVNVTDWPTVDGFAELASVMKEPPVFSSISRLSGAYTPWNSVAISAAPSPLKSASVGVMEQVPSTSPPPV